MNEIKIFNHQQFGQIRTAGTVDNPLFCLADICRVLELRTDATIKRLKQDAPIRIGVIDRLGRKQDAIFINEQNLYKVIMRSDKPQAEPFQDWVCGEVLPTIRKTGGYRVQTMTALPNFEDPAEAARAWAHEFEQKCIEQKRADEAEKQVLVLEIENKELENENIQLTVENQELRHDKNYLDIIMRSKELVTMTQIAQDYGMSAVTMNKKLAQMKIQYSINGQWILYADYKDKGYVSSKSFEFIHQNGHRDVKMNTCWTQKGRKFLYEQLKERGVLPLIER